ncbi:RNA 3'-terminal phosphate cyclase [Coccidioides immitis RMSCC 2394]|uniref:RNA 3'-terminal phosphate cyclase n=1 Tax=Coccidioides immitis RMSCC 2394 TaxID=404692 RepID=A0A0J7B0B2_COCIT|nr:RNA 3'-terminal phosphate cyclase [Coccidioides immitis RMSCC 2394]
MAMEENMYNSLPVDYLPPMIHLDGSTLEGGGQLLRNAVALSALTSRPVKITRIRANRQGPGLRPSHAVAIQCLRDVCGGTAVNATVGSSEITFYPRGQLREDGDVASEEEANDGDEGLAAPLEAMIKLESMNDVLPIQSEYNIRLKTPGSAFLIFQALYPYLLYAGACHNAQVTERNANLRESSIKLSVTGGTNVSFSLSHDYFSQVLIPNFAKLGLPQLSVNLKHRGWSAGQTNLGSVSFLITPLKLRETREESNEGAASVDNHESLSDSGAFSPIFPRIDLHVLRRGRITQIDITVLAPDMSLDEAGSARRSKRGNKYHHPNSKQSHITDSKDRSQEEDLGLDSDSDGSPEMQQPGKRFAPNSVREFIENYTFEKVSHEFGAKRKGNSSFQPPKIELHWSESTHHRSRIYVLLVAHTSTGFRLGRDALLGSPSSLESNKKSGHKGPRKSKRKGKSRTNADHKTGTDLERMIGDLVDQCVEDLMYELADGSGTRDLKKILGDGFSNRFLDSFMRDQVVVFQALGKLGAGDADMPLNQDEERDLSLHTRTAMWVCEQMLGVKF